MSRDIVCLHTGQRFNGTADEARALGWRKNWDGWEAPSPGWDRLPAAPLSREFVAYENGIDFDPVPLNFGGGR